MPHPILLLTRPQCPREMFQSLARGGRNDYRRASFYFREEPLYLLSQENISLSQGTGSRSTSSTGIIMTKPLSLRSESSHVNCFCRACCVMTTERLLGFISGGCAHGLYWRQSGCAFVSRPVLPVRTSKVVLRWARHEPPDRSPGQAPATDKVNPIVLSFPSKILTASEAGWQKPTQEIIVVVRVLHNTTSHDAIAIDFHSTQNHPSSYENPLAPCFPIEGSAVLCKPDRRACRTGQSAS